MAVLPVWRSPMISSRWPRPIGIRASIALRPVGIGSCTDLRGMMPGALTSTRARLRRVDRALAVDRIAERVDDAAEQLLADRHVDDGAGALDRLAFLDVAVGAEDDDADIVALEVQRHAAHAALELDHFAGLDIVEAIDAGDAVTDRENLADLGDFGFSRRNWRSRSSGSRKFLRRGCPSADLFHTCAKRIEFGFERRRRSCASRA